MSGTETRHPLSMQEVAPIGSGTDYKKDVSRALHFRSLIEENYAANLPELAIRYSITNKNLSTIEVWIATNEELITAVEAVNRGPVSPTALTEIKNIQNHF